MKYHTIYPFGENNESGFQSIQVPVWKALLVLFRMQLIRDQNFNNHYGLDRTMVCTGSGMYRLHCMLLRHSESAKFLNRILLCLQ